MLGRKVVYVRCINCSYNNVTKGIRLPDEKAIFSYTGKTYFSSMIHTSITNVFLQITIIQILGLK